MACPIMHIELQAADLAAAAKFYRHLFGWESTEYGPEWSLFAAGKGPGGGFVREMPEGHPVVFYIEVDDIEGKLKEIEAAGGKTLHPKTRISEEHGFYGMFADLHGVAVGLWSRT